MTLDATRSTLSNAQSVLRNQAIHSGEGNGKLGKDDFMNLFLTQMSNQDPTSPMDSAGMTAQMAQLGSMEQLANLNKGMEALNKTQSAAASYQALNFMGKDVALDSGKVNLSQGSGNPVYFNLQQDAADIKVLIEAQDGSPVLNHTLGLTSAGKHSFAWDGLNDRGTMMAEGQYKIRVIAKNADGTSSELNAYNTGRISQVEFKNGQAYLSSQGRQLPLSAVKSVNNSSQSIFGEAKPMGLFKALKPIGLVTKTVK